LYQNTAAADQPPGAADLSIGRIVSVTGSKAIVLLDDNRAALKSMAGRPEMGTLLGIDTELSIGLGLVSALSVPVPAQKDGDPEVWIAELSLVGEIQRSRHNHPGGFNRGLTTYPALGDRVRVASKDELLKAFSAPGESAVKVGVIRQDATIAAMVKTDDLLGKHFAILGTTGTGKSCTTALILRAILDKNPEAHIVLLDPHNEYATSFGDRAEVVTTQNLHLPYWLLTFEELVEVLIGNSDDHKPEVEILQELIPACKGRYGKSARENERTVKRTSIYAGRYSVDTPVPYRMSDVLQMLDDKMGMLENKKDLSPYRSLKTRIDTISQDQRYAFMFGGFTVNDQMAEILGRIFRVPVVGKPITIVELTGLPTEIVNVVVSVLCRMTFDFALWGEGNVPVTLVCEEAHRYVPANSTLGFEPAKRAIAKIAKEGRKYGASLCIVTQRPAEIDATILSQCNTVFALRMSNDRDQEIVRAAVSDTGSGMLEFLPSLGQREAIAFGDGVSLPVRIKFDELPKSALPRSSTARFSEKWQKPAGDEAFMHSVVERWRASGSPHMVSGAEDIATEVHNHAQAEQPNRRLPQPGASSMPQNTPRPAASAGPAPVARPASAPQPVPAAARRVLVTPPLTPAPETGGSGSSIRRSGLAASLLRRKE
jgi:DNA helicase HerA-like ATPase